MVWHSTTYGSDSFTANDWHVDIIYRLCDFYTGMALERVSWLAEIIV